MRLHPIEVECYAGYQANETPRRYFHDNHWIEIQEVIDRWYQIESQPEWPRADYYKVISPNHHEYLLKHDHELDAWFLCQSWQARNPMK